MRITKATRGTSVLPENERAEIEKRLAYENDVIVSHNFEKSKQKSTLGTDSFETKRENVKLWSVGFSPCSFCR